MSDIKYPHTRTLHVRLSDDELRLVKTQAMILGISQSSYIRSKIKPPVIGWPNGYEDDYENVRVLLCPKDLFTSVRYQMRRVGANLHQSSKVIEEIAGTLDYEFAELGYDPSALADLVEENLLFHKQIDYHFTQLKFRLDTTFSSLVFFDVKEKRDNVVHVRLTEFDHLRLRGEAMFLGLNITSLVRAMLRLPIVPETEDVREGEQITRRLLCDDETFASLPHLIQQWGYDVDCALHSLNTMRAANWGTFAIVEKHFNRAMAHLGSIGRWREQFVEVFILIDEKTTIRDKDYFVPIV